MSRPSKDTYWGLVEWAASEHPRRVVLCDDFGRSLTTVGLRDAAVAAAAALAERGVHAGTVVSWQLPTTLETMVVMVALARLGAVQNPILPIWRESEVGFATTQLGTEVMIVPGMWREFDHVALARSLAEKREMTIVVVDHETAPAAGGLRLPAGNVRALPGAPSSGDDARWVYYSSGTTAAPKGVRHTDRSVMAGSAGVVGMVGGSSSDINPIPFPISHIGGAAMLAASLLTGMRLVLFDSFDAATTPFAIAAHRPTLLGTATPFFVAFMAAQQRHGAEPLFPDLRACVAGGAPITAELGRQVRETFSVPGIANAWGLTEFPVATSPVPDADAAVLDYTVGPPVPGVQVRVVGDDGREVRSGDEGELRLKGPQCFLGYVDESLNADAFDTDGWFCTGDRGRIDKNGNVVVTGRIKDAIIRNAENISALEIEGVLAAHPAVADVAVIGVPDPRTGERVCAVVVAEPGVELALSSLVRHCQDRGLSRHKFPERLEVVDMLPRNLTGKVLKAELRSRFRGSAL
ncbi:class I adenylate-forming enzyme family protein [Mycobacterium kyorinense]|uniref:Cyclohexanecarboxylate-CoA ligase n=1 Tax=Mycobacterium kyorinense TaxID=487514 RepID=A0A1X1XQU8_9MYCO|nr:AMP-binding protein [Mycobacterium kyorinense]ORW01228.1 cyclohexanecarboxylate-CoA ligase [Mycobacterium kyorinense]